ncbi:MAG TPA: hypothetical protein VHA82_12730 [Ramlibacter sp.]|uniref:hypothetical protein n=1 Tax=Ramlibacter sp. TaxID=1917967 RepID=UPI002CC41F7A|nr:hypothetical protein [Ramlibacter sp.]HVZ44667.1 hypothetical protein [Ramlibacter sp.]
MKLIVTVRHQKRHLRVGVTGQWEYNDALSLAYQLKAAALRAGEDHMVLDLRQLGASPGVEGPFLIGDRLQRVLPAGFAVAVVATAELVDVDSNPLAGTPGMARFDTERAALAWLEKIPRSLRSEGQTAGKET